VTDPATALCGLATSQSENPCDLAPIPAPLDSILCTIAKP